MGALGLITLGLVLIGSAMLAGTVDGSAPRQRAGSTWSEAPDGASRLHALLQDRGRAVARHEGALSDLPVEGILVVLQPPGGLRDHEEAALLDRVARGATLILASEEVPSTLAGLGLRARRHPLARVAQPLVPSAQAAAGPGLAAVGDTLLDAVPGLAPLYATEEGVLLGGLVVGEGTVLLLTDPAQLSNAGLEHGANLRLAGTMFPDSGGPVTFVEGVHGYTAARGLLPWLFRAGWAPMLLAALLAAGAAGWRAASQAPRGGLAARPGGGGLVRLAGAVGRMRLDQGLHARSLGQFVQEARRRRIPEDHPAVAAARRAWRDPDLDAAAALSAAEALEGTWR